MGRRRTLIEWNTVRDSTVLRDLSKFRTRAVGERLRTLALLGLEAEAMGFRVDASGDTPAVVAPANLHAGSSLKVDRDLVETTAPPNARNPEHQSGLLDVLSGLGVPAGH